jgi:hypothetical protein
VRVRLAAILCVSLAAAGCGGGGADEVAGPGFTIDVPAGWRTIDAKTVLEQQAQEDAAARPELARALRELAKPNSPVKLFAYDPRARDGFATNVNVLVTNVPGDVAFDDWSELNVRDVRKIAMGLETRSLTLPAGRALRLAYRTSAFADRELTLVQYLLLGERRAYVLTLTTLPGLEAEYTDELEAMTKSLRID